MAATSLPHLTKWKNHALHAHFEIEEKIRHAARNVLKVAVAQPSPLWVNLLSNPFMDLHDTYVNLKYRTLPVK